MFANKLQDRSTRFCHLSTPRVLRMELPALVDTLSSASEFEELPVRHNEVKNTHIICLWLWRNNSSGQTQRRAFHASPMVSLTNMDHHHHSCREVDVYSLDSPFTKANILFQAHFARLELPISDYYTDLRSVLDQAIRVLQAMVCMHVVFCLFECGNSNDSGGFVCRGRLARYNHENHEFGSNGRWKHIFRLC